MLLKKKFGQYKRFTWRPLCCWGGDGFPGMEESDEVVPRLLRVSPDSSKVRFILILLYFCENAVVLQVFSNCVCVCARARDEEPPFWRSHLGRKNFPFSGEVIFD